MKLKVLKSFTDKYSGEFYTSGLIIDVKDKRGEELLSHPLELVEKIEEPKDETTVNDSPKVKRTKKSE